MNMVDEYIYDRNYTEKAVLTGACALARNGLTTTSLQHLDIQTSHKELDGLYTVPCSFHYNNAIDMEYQLTKSESNSLLLLPSKERALVECIKHLDWCDEGILIEALKSYLQWFRDDEKLYECAKHFGVEKDTIDYWINEALTDEEV